MTILVSSGLALLILAGCLLLVCATWRFGEMVWRRDAASRLIAGTEACLSAQAKAESSGQA